MAKRYTWTVRLNINTNGRFYQWIVLDGASTPVEYGSAPSRAIAVLTAARAARRLNEANQNSAGEGVLPENHIRA
jgi:hypothetical protein